MTCCCICYMFKAYLHTVETERQHLSQGWNVSKRSLNIIWLYHYQSGLSSWSSGESKDNTVFCEPSGVFTFQFLRCVWLWAGEMSWLWTCTMAGSQLERLLSNSVSAGLSHFLLISILHIAAGSKHDKKVLFRHVVQVQFLSKEASDNMCSCVFFRVWTTWPGSLWCRGTTTHRRLSHGDWRPTKPRQSPS